MPKVKIISNPYKKETKFQRWSNDENAWIDINYDNNEKSKLVNNELTSGFFPFKARKIVEAFASEYDPHGVDDGVLEIDFEGSADEYDELADVCADEQFKDVIRPVKSKIYLKNARDILPEVKKLFQEMSPLIVQSVSQEKIQADLSRFSDASSDVVPICVMGNYSAGKSTFINALVGSEILPSGNETVTSKVYKISRSRYADRANVKCKYLSYDIDVQINGENTEFPETYIENELTTQLKNALLEMSGESIVSRVNKALSIINDFEGEEDEPKVSDLIEVSIPFTNGVLAKSQHPFVIFDTPGSNSASNARHLKVLKEAMANMTNGLPIFLSTPDNLDTTDNESLYHVIREMEELDSRFTMIVVNKADTAGIQRRGATIEEQNRILRQAVPRNLYSGGMFYVSSILGLGSKTQGKFIDYIYEDIYDAQVDRYENADNKHYKTLYLFNIQPSQLKKRSDKLAAEQSELVYANSGLFTIENEIDQFAGIYSAYNKCFQSQMFLTRVIQITGEEIEDKKIECEGIRQSIKDKLEADKKVLLEKIDASATENRDEFIASYQGYMAEFLDGAGEVFSVQDIQKQVEIYTKEHEEKLDFEGHSNEAKQARDSLADNLKSNITKALKERNASSIKNIVDGLHSDFDAAVDSFNAQRDVRQQVTRDAADSVLEYVKDKYEKKLLEIYEILDSKSREYWTSNTEKLRDVLAQIVSGSEVLTEERRKELERIIITYQKLAFKDETAETIFDKVNFERRIKIGDFVLFQSDYLNNAKIAKTYNAHISKGANERYSAIEENHKSLALSWIQNLLDEIYENIVEYSPELSKQAKQIRIMTEHIEELEQRQNRLKQYTLELEQMMDWKVSESEG